MTHAIPERYRNGALARAIHGLRAWLLIGMTSALVACGGGGGGGDDNSPPETGTLRATVVDDFGSPVQGATVAATINATTRSSTTDAAGVATVTSVGVGSVSVEVSLATYATETVTATITANQTTDLPVTLTRNRQAAGGALTTSVVNNDGSTMTIRVRVVVVNEISEAIDNLTPADFQLNDCTPSADLDCVRVGGSSGNIAYTVLDATPQCAPSSTLPNCTVPGQLRTAQAAALLLDQSGSVGNNSDPTGARLFSSKEFLETVTLGGDDFALLAAFAADRTDPVQTALIPEQPLTVYNNGTFTTDGESFFDELDDLASQAGGGTPLYRSLFPEPLTDNVVDPDFTAGMGMIDVVRNAPEVSGLPKSIVLFTDGQDEECGGSTDPCPAKRARVIQHADPDPNIEDIDDVRIFTIGLSNEVDFQALGELASKTGGVALFAETAEQLLPLYGSLGALLSDSLLTYEFEWTINAAAGTFVTGNSVLGRVEVNAGGTEIKVPFIVGIP